MAALDTFALGKIPFVRGILGQAGIKVTDDVAAAVARKGVLNTSLDYAKTAGTTATFEGATEAGQQFLRASTSGVLILPTPQRAKSTLIASSGALCWVELFLQPVVFLSVAGPNAILPTRRPPLNVQV